MLRNCILKVNFIPKRLAGHSKWANIRHTKAEKDGERSALFTRLSRQIKVAVTEGGSTDPSKNLKLSHLVDQCKRFSMPAATLQSVLKSCENDKSNAKLYTIDIRGPGGCIIVCELYTNNLHHTKQIIATQLKKNKSKFSDGAGLHGFHEKGLIEAENPELSAKPKDEQLELATDHAIECNAEDVTMSEENVFQFSCSKEAFPKTQTLLEKLGYKIINSTIDYVPVQMQQISEADLPAYEKLMSRLDEMPEVIRLFDNVSSS